MTPFGLIQNAILDYTDWSPEDLQVVGYDYYVVDLSTPPGIIIGDPVRILNDELAAIFGGETPNVRQVIAAEGGLVCMALASTFGSAPPTVAWFGPGAPPAVQYVPPPGLTVVARASLDGMSLAPVRGPRSVLLPVAITVIATGSQATGYLLMTPEGIALSPLVPSAVGIMAGWRLAYSGVLTRTDGEHQLLRGLAIPAAWAPQV